MRGLKIGVKVFLTPSTYVAVNNWKRVSGMDVYDHDTDFKPFRIRVVDVTGRQDGDN